jgi:5'-3' exonuclease
MTIDGLNTFLKNKHPEVYTNKHISYFSFKIVVFDISSYIFKYMSSYGKERWLLGMLNLFLLFKKHAVHVIPIFDGKAPKEKQEEQQDRRENRNKSEENLMEIRIALDRYKNNNIIDNVLIKAMEKAKAKYTKVSLLRKPSSKNEEQKIDANLIEKLIEQRDKNQFEITKEDINNLKAFLNVFKIPYLEAPDEAEALGCYLVNTKKAFAILSLDSDCMAYKTDRIINELNVSTGDCNVIFMEDLLTQLEFETPEQVTDFCIICGNDYNRYSKAVSKVGPVNAKNLIIKFKSIEEIRKNDKRFQIENDGLLTERCRELFNLKYPNINNNLYWDTNINLNDVYDFFSKRKLMIDLDKVKTLWKPLTISFEEDEIKEDEVEEDLEQDKLEETNEEKDDNQDESKEEKDDNQDESKEENKTGDTSDKENEDNNQESSADEQ